MACFRAVVRVGCMRRPATGAPDEWSSIALSWGEDRTRLTGHLARIYPRSEIGSQGVRLAREGWSAALFL